MRIDDNGVIREMTKEEIAEYKAAVTDWVQETTMEEKVERLTNAIEGIKALLKKIGLEVG